MTPPTGDRVQLHATLTRQLRRLRLTESQPPTQAQWESLLVDVSEFYKDADLDRETLERAVDISSAEMHDLNETLARQASTDPLTGLLNRASLIEELTHLLTPHPGRAGTFLGVLFLDLDGFKLINDRLGHAAGDALLRATANRLRAGVRGCDVVARIGGDEFVVVTPALPAADVARELAERLVVDLSSAVPIPGQRPVGVGVSIGVTTLAADERSTSDLLLAEADTAMYAAKVGGRNQVVAFSPALASEKAPTSTVSELRQGLGRGELVLHYQPLVCLAHERTVAMEALLRWDRPGHGLVPPADFIPTAELSPLIHEITRNVLEQAGHAAASWPDELLVSVNLSAKDVARPDLATTVDTVIAGTGTAVSRIVLEVTEHTLVSWDEATLARLTSLAAAGVRLAIDDFGSGYSSLAQLRDLPVQIVKLDRSFIDRVAAQQTHSAIVSTVLRLAQILGLAVVAEGVETAEQADTLRSLGCGFAQGYLFGRPSPEPDVSNVGCPECSLGARDATVPQPRSRHAVAR